MARASTLYYMAGITRDAGDYFDGIPARDLEPDDIAPLSDAVYAHITGAPPFAEGSPFSGPLYSAEKPGTGTETSLKSMTRAELNALATNRGVSDPESFANKDALIEAIEATDTTADVPTDEGPEDGDDGATAEE